MVVELTVRAESLIPSPRLVLAIEDSMGRRIMTFASFMQGVSMGDIIGDQLVVCTIPCLNLGVGRYLLSVSIGDPYNGLIDSLDGVAWFEVVWDNNYGNGEAYIPVYGPVLTRSTWRLQEKRPG